MNPNEEGFQKALAAAELMQESAQRFLYLYWVLATERLNRLTAESANLVPPPRSDEAKPEWMRNAQEHIDKSENLQLLLRRVESYLGHKPKVIDQRALEDAKSLAAVRWVRASIQIGDSDEEIAAWLRNFLALSTKENRGRKAGTIDSDGHALLALVLYERNPKVWSYPKLADHFCKKGRPHAADSKCVDKLKKAVMRLRKFLQVLGYEPARK